jgi:hypothetical protein
MKYTYVIEIYEGNSFRVETDGPMPHLAPGNRLCFNSEEFGMKQGTVLEIKHVEARLTAAFGKAVATETRVYCSELTLTPENSWYIT